MPRLVAPRTARARGGKGDAEADVSHGAATRDRLLAAAIELFAARGFEDVTVREICDLARANIAAVNYHFRDKLGLYLAVLGTAIDHMRDTSDLTKRVSADSSPEQRFRHYVRTYLHRLTATDGPASWIHRLLRHETSKPTPAATEIFERAIRPRLEYLSGVVAELIGCAPSDPRVARCVMSVQAQCLMYRPDPFRDAVSSRWPVRSGSTDTIADHIAEFSLAGIRATAGGVRDTVP